MPEFSSPPTTDSKVRYEYPSNQTKPGTHLAGLTARPA